MSRSTLATSLAWVARSSAIRASCKIACRWSTASRRSKIAARPIVNVCGGEPTLYPELKGLIDGLIARDKHIILCTNALKLDTKVFGIIPPSPRLFLMIHLDGMKETHDFVCNREGVFDTAVAMIKQGKSLGYRIYLNATVYKETDIAEIEALCKLTDKLRADGILVSPGYEYASVRKPHFSERKRRCTRSSRPSASCAGIPRQRTPAFLEFAAGMRDLSCSPWSTVNLHAEGLEGPCYLIEGEGYFQDWNEFWEKTDWEYWESRQDEHARIARCTRGSSTAR